MIISLIVTFGMAAGRLQTAHGSTSQIPVGTQASAQFPPHATARLVLVTGPNFPGDPYWRPDGSAATSADLKQAQGGSIRNSTTRAGIRTVNLFLNIEGVNSAVADGVRLKFDAGPDTTVRSLGEGELNPMPAHLSLSTGHLPPTFPISKVEASVTVDFPAGRERSDIRVGIADSKYSVVARVRPGEAPLNAKLTAPGAGQSFVVVAVDLPSKLIGKDFRISALNAAGKPLPVLPSTDSLLGGPVAGNRTSITLFTRSPADVRFVKLEARDYNWVRFREIHLAPTAPK
jgi:hypothetical protein